MSIPFLVQNFDLPTADQVCKLVTTVNLTTRYFVSSQPVYIAGRNPYPVIASANIRNLICVRDPSETTPPNAFDTTESGQLILSKVAYTNTPLPHIITPPGTMMSQQMFDEQAFDAARTIHLSPLTSLIHCSTGDRASAAFGVFLIEYAGYGNDDALKFATEQLVLQNPYFKAFLHKYTRRAV